MGGLQYPAAVRTARDRIIEVTGLEAYSDQGKPLFPGDLLEQTRYVLDLIETILGEAGVRLDGVARFSVFTTHLDQWQTVWRQVESLVQPTPAMTVVGVPSLVGDVAMIEIETTATASAQAQPSREPEEQMTSIDSSPARAILPESLAGRDWELHAAAFVVEDGDLVFLSGIGPVDKDGNTVGAGDPAAQTQQVIANIEEILRTAGGSLDNVLRVRVFTTDLKHRPAINAERAKAFNAPRPGSTFIQVSQLEMDDWLVEIEATAAVPRRR
jgi:2-iminobutanoate/2-iminopropanoate deaminase